MWPLFKRLSAILEVLGRLYFIVPVFLLLFGRIKDTDDAVCKNAFCSF